VNPPKREPLLADLFLASQYPVRFAKFMAPGFIGKIRTGLYEAKRFVMDDAACRYIAEAIVAAPEAIAMAQEFALLPFPTMYVELPNFHEWYRMINHREPQPDSDRKVAYLFMGPTVYTLGMTADNNPVVVPIEYRLNIPWQGDSKRDLAGLFAIPEAQMGAISWGSSMDALQGTQWQDALINQHSMANMIRREAALKMDVEMRHFYALSNAGDLRNMLAILLFLNRTGQVTYKNEIPMGRQMIRNKPRTLLAHSVVTLDVARAPSVRTVFKGVHGGSWKREHDVRGHFCVGKVAREAVACSGIHDWVEYDVNQWRCARCGGLKWWRKDCRRGTRNKGRVHTTYEVTSRAVHTSARQGDARE
jgi:hypothetical protein